MQMGFLKQMKKEKLPEVRVCPLDLGDTERKLSFRDLLLTYKIVATGIGSAVLIFFCELFYQMYKKSTGKRKNPKVQKKKVKKQKKTRKIQVEHITVTPPPQYSFLEKQMRFPKDIINGREYYVVTNPNGERNLIPIRTPSAYLFR